MKSAVACCVLLLAARAAQAGALDVVERDGSLSVVCGGRTVVSSLAVDRGDVGDGDVRTSTAELPDGSKVWNRWSEVRDRRFRVEVAKRADGAVEITMAGTVDAESAVRRRWLELRLSEDVFRGQPFEVVNDNISVFQRRTGVFADGLKPQTCRWLASSGFTFDLNPLGPGDDFGATKSTADGHSDSVRAWAELASDGTGWTIRAGDDVRSAYGGYIGAKIVIREGMFDDYDKFHLIRKYHYMKPLVASHLLAFGSPRRGSAYAEGDVAYLSTRGYGWTQDFSRDNCQRKSIVGFREGAYYSALAGTSPDTYRIGNLADGHYLLSFMAGNFAGVSNRFSVAAGDVRILSDVSVPTGCLRTVTRAVHVKGGHLDISLSGDWLLSVLALQPVLADGEDFSVGRGFWLTRGYEPGVICRSDDWQPFRPGVSDETLELPVPGTEFAGEPREPPAPVEVPDPDSPELAWTKSARIHRLFNNTSTLSQLDDAEVRERFLDREFSGRDVTAAMISGTLTRHTRPAREEAMIGSVGQLVQSLHRRGIRAFDHLDVTILWNSETGFRLMMERPDRLLRRWDSGLPTYLACISNPSWRERFFRQLRKTISTGVDALQLDEVYHWHKGCVCRHCREKFFRETGWRVPMNECDPAWQDPLSPFMRRWRDWRIRDCTNFFVELRRRAKDVNPNLVLSAYTYTGGLVSSASGDIGQELLDLSRTVNFFGVEVMSRSVLRSARAELPFRRAQNIFTFAYGAPVWDWYYNADAATDYAAWAMSEMTCQSPMLSDVPAAPGIPNYAGFGVAQGAMSRVGAEPVADVALFFSSHTRDLNIEERWVPSLFGIAQALEALHVPYVFVPDVNLTAKRLAAYKVLVLTGVEHLTDADRRLLEGFERSGGRIVRGIARAAEFCQRSLLDNPYSAAPDIYDFNPDPAAEREFRERVRSAVGDAGWWRVAAPDKVATSVWREKAGTLVLHFLNLTGVENRVDEAVVRTAPDPAFPPLARDIVFTVPDAAACRAEAVSPDFAGARPLSSQANADGSLTVTLPRDLLSVYTLIRIGPADAITRRN